MRYTTLCSIVFSAALLSSQVSRADDAANLIANSGFENPPDAPASYSLFVPAEAQAAKCRFTISTDTFHGGAQSALMQADDFARFSLGPIKSIPVTAGDVYQIGIWVKGGSDFLMQPSSPGVVIRLNQVGGTPPKAAGFTFVYLNNTISEAGPPTFSPVTVTAPAPADWTHIVAVMKMPAGVDHVAPALFFWRAKGSLDVDDFTLQKVDPATPLSTPNASSSSVSPAALSPIVSKDGHTAVGQAVLVDATGEK